MSHHIIATIYKASYIWLTRLTHLPTATLIVETQHKHKHGHRTTQLHVPDIMRAHARSRNDSRRYGYVPITADFEFTWFLFGPSRLHVAPHRALTVTRSPCSHLGVYAGHSYERHHIEKWLLNHDTSPKTGVPLPNKNLVPAHALRNAIEEWTGTHAQANQAEADIVDCASLPDPLERWLDDDDEGCGGWPRKPDPPAASAPAAAAAHMESGWPKKPAPPAASAPSAAGRWPKPPSASTPAPRLAVRINDERSNLLGSRSNEYGGYHGRTEDVDTRLCGTATTVLQVMFLVFFPGALMMCFLMASFSWLEGETGTMVYTWPQSTASAS